VNRPRVSVLLLARGTRVRELAAGLGVSGGKDVVAVA
jgi:hypothetical protein